MEVAVNCSIPHCWLASCGAVHCPRNSTRQPIYCTLLMQCQSHHLSPLNPLSRCSAYHTSLPPWRRSRSVPGWMQRGWWMAWSLTTTMSFCLVASASTGAVKKGAGLMQIAVVDLLLNDLTRQGIWNTGICSSATGRLCSLRQFWVSGV